MKRKDYRLIIKVLVLASKISRSNNTMPVDDLKIIQNHHNLIRETFLTELALDNKEFSRTKFLDEYDKTVKNLE